MRVARSARFLLCLACAGCAISSRRTQAPAFTRGEWKIRIDVDSVPSRKAPTQPIVGTINFATGHYKIDLFRALSRRDIVDTVRVLTLPRADARESARYRIIFGDSTSVDERIVMTGSAITRDSLMGTWTETVLCCSAVGRFTLWRVK